MGQLTMSRDLTGDLQALLVYVVGITFVRFALSGLVSTWLKGLPCVFRLLSRGLEEGQRRKMHENLWYTLWHTLSFTWGATHLAQQSWAHELFIEGTSDAISGGYPQSAESLGCKTFYLVELGFWLSCSLYLFFETRRKDFVEMSVHHLSTVALIVLSFLYDFGRPGILVMLIHDIGDIFLYSAKSAQYRKLSSLADALFAIFAVVFFVSRWGVFPFKVIFPLIKAIMGGSNHINQKVVIEYGQAGMLTVLAGLLCTLLCLHLMWGCTIVRMVKKTILCNKLVSADGDPRSDDEILDKADAKVFTNSAIDSKLRKRN